MSGFVAIFNLDGAPVDPELLRRLVDPLSRDAPDGAGMHLEGVVGMGHALLRSTFESGHEHQPIISDDQLWVVGDARVDGRATLLSQLEPVRRERLKDAPDIQLILAAYQEWGADCVYHLIGDFAFVIWDRPRGRLFCARDHFGVKPFYYAQVGRSLVLSNMLNCIRQHPDVSNNLNEAAIGDFLLVGYNADPATTTFADIQRLPPAHTMTCAEGQVSRAPYWTLPTDGHIRYKRPDDYVECFRDLFFAAVGDRLRTDKIVVPMSGGMDSTSVAAVAQDRMAAAGYPSGVEAVTVVYGRAFRDPERTYARLAAEALGIPIEFLTADDVPLFEHWERSDFRPAEPWNAPLPDGITGYGASTETGRVLLSGLGGDPLLYPSSSYWIDLLRSKKIQRLTLELTSFILSERRLPPLYFRSAMKREWPRRFGIVYPAWIDAGFEAKCGLRDRWESLDVIPDLRHPHREAYQFLISAYWPSVIFERSHPGTARIPVETRYPFFDLRLVNFVLAIPPFPWCSGKFILRAAMRGILPEMVRKRPKTLLAGNPILWRLKQDEKGWQDILLRVPALALYVERDRVIPEVNSLREQDPHNLFVMNLRPFSLAHWLELQEGAG